MSTLLEMENDQVNLLHRISSIISSELSMDEQLGEIIGLTAQVTGCDACLVYLIETETHEIVLRASQVPHARDLGTLRMKMGEGVTGWVAEHKSVVALSSNAAADRRFKRFLGADRRYLRCLPVGSFGQQGGDHRRNQCPSPATA